MIRVSVVIPTYRRPELLERCLRALDQQDLDPGAFEVLVADDAASEATRAQVESRARTMRPAVRYIAVTQRHGPAAARNAGWRAARGAIVAFTDDDCRPEPGWLSCGLAAFGEDTAAVSGQVMVPLPDDPTDYERDASGLERAEFVTANCFCRRAALEQVGGFDERFAAAWREDSDLQFALLRAGLKIVRAPGAVVVHPVRPAAWGVSVRQQQKVLFDALLYKKHPDLYRDRVRAAPPWNYYATVGCLAAAGLAFGLGRTPAALVALGGWALLTGRFCVRRLRRTSHAPRHIAEMVATSALIPLLSVFWRLYGAWKFRVLFL